MKRIPILLAAAVVIFLAGFIPQYLKCRDTTLHLAETEEQRRTAELIGDLGVILIEVEQNNFGNAQTRSTRFFDAVQRAVELARDATLKERLNQTLARRDEITADLAALNKDSADKLRKMYLKLRGQPDLAQANR